MLPGVHDMKLFHENNVFTKDSYIKENTFKKVLSIEKTYIYNLCKVLTNKEKHFETKQFSYQIKLFKKKR